MESQLRIRELISEQLLESQRENPAFSLRALAKKLDLSPSTISEILQGKRRASQRLAKKISEKIMLSPEDTEALLESFRADFERKFQDEAVSKQRAELKADEFHCLAAWEDFAILALFGIKNSKSTTKNNSYTINQISKRLDLPRKKIELAVARLLRLQFLQQTKAGKLMRLKKGSFSSTDGVSDVGVRKSHHESLSLARSAIDNLSVEERDITNFTFAINSKKFPEAQKRIRAFQVELSQFLQDGAEDEVFKLNIQFFPVSNSKGSEE